MKARRQKQGPIPPCGHTNRQTELTLVDVTAPRGTLELEVCSVDGCPEFGRLYLDLRDDFPENLEGPQVSEAKRIMADALSSCSSCEEGFCPIHEATRAFLDVEPPLRRGEVSEKRWAKSAGDWKAKIRALASAKS